MEPKKINSVCLHILSKYYTGMWYTILRSGENEKLFIDNKKINILILQFHPRREIVAEPEEESKKKCAQGRN